MLKLTDPEDVQAKCTVVDPCQDLNTTFSQFIMVGFGEDGETIVTAADLRDLAKGIDILIEIYTAAMGLAHHDVRREVETDLIIEATMKRGNTPNTPNTPNTHDDDEEGEKH